MSKRNFRCSRIAGAVVSFSITCGFGHAQSEADMQIQIDRLNNCTSLEKTWMDLSKQEQAISTVIDCSKPHVVCQNMSDFEAVVSRVEAGNTEYDLNTLEQKQLKKVADTLRQILGQCSDVEYHDKTWQAQQLMELGDILIKLGQAEDALAILQRCVSAGPDFAGCLETLGEAEKALGRRDEARASFKRAISIGGFDQFNALFVDRSKQELQIMDSEDQANPTSAESSPDASRHVFGTGFFVSADGEILTNDHVVAGCRQLTIKGGSPLQIESRDSSADLALVKSDIKPAKTAVFRSGPVPKAGDEVVTFGFPLPGLLSSEGNVSNGVISATTGLQNDVRFVQITAPVQPGNSGGPVFDQSGHVIGVVVAKLDAVRIAQITGDIPENVNFAVHWSEVRALLDEQAVHYMKMVSQRSMSTRDIATIGAAISVTLDCLQ